MFKQISTKVLTAALIAGTLGIATAGSAQAGFHGHHGGRGWGAVGAVGLGLGVLGAIAATNAYNAPVEDVELRRVCRSEPQFNDYGEYVGRARICKTVAY